jgi:uroporphyrinogen decarboxylase
MPAITVKPDFARFKDVLLLKRVCKRPPLFDFHVAVQHKQAILGRPIQTAADDVAFWEQAGYDYVHAPIYLPVPELRQAMEAEKLSSGSSTTGSCRQIISDLGAYRSRMWAWQQLAEGDRSLVQENLDYLKRQAEALPDGMKLIFHVADIFTYAWEMIGFNNLCYASLDDPEFVGCVINDLGMACRQLVEISLEALGDAVGSILYSDDIAYTEGLMLGPDFFREHLFGHIAAIVELGRRIDVPLIYHSDGKLYDVFDDLARIGVRGIQPLEPKSMDPLKIKTDWPGRFCLIGNIDLDLMATGSPEDVAAHVREKIDRLNQGGGYIVGVSNTVPHYVRLENYLTMIQTVYGYGNSDA